MMQLHTLSSLNSRTAQSGVTGNSASEAWTPGSPIPPWDATLPQKHWQWAAPCYQELQFSTQQPKSGKKSKTGLTETLLAFVLCLLCHLHLSLWWFSSLPAYLEIWMTPMARAISVLLWNCSSSSCTPPLLSWDCCSTLWLCPSCFLRLKSCQNLQSTW